MAGRWITGWKLPQADRQRLLELVPPRYPRVVADHVTRKAGADEGAPLPAGTAAEVMGEADDGTGVQALVVRIGETTDRPDGSTYHLTWSLGPGRRAVESNDVIARLGWRAWDAPVTIALSPGRWAWGRV